jgi:hypothetical protein
MHPPLEISENELKIIEDLKDNYLSIFKDQFDDIYGPFKPTPLKSLEQQESERNQLYQKFINLSETDIKRGLQLFFDNITEEENQKLKNFFNNYIHQNLVIFEVKNVKDSFNELDYELLENITNRQFANHKYEESSCMFRFIIQTNFIYFPAWVGWADSEKSLGRHEIVAAIYEMAMAFFPNNPYLVLFAADFYISNNQKDIAISLLNDTKSMLITEKMQDSNSFKEIQNFLNKLN